MSLRAWFGSVLLLRHTIALWPEASELEATHWPTPLGAASPRILRADRTGARGSRARRAGRVRAPNAQASQGAFATWSQYITQPAHERTKRTPPSCDTTMASAPASALQSR